MEFRRDIHGLRGVSVLLVILFHAGAPLFEGGFIGVDIFFVISGYLITSILYKEIINNGSIRLRDFYWRRVKRILPAALFWLIVFSIIAVVLFPQRMQQFGLELLAAASAVSNILYGLRTDYFALTSEENLFLNYWSLAVEEQFYLLWPLGLALMFPVFKSRPVCFALSVVALLFGLSIIQWNISSLNNFYHLTGRAWELMMGAAIAIIPATALKWHRVKAIMPDIGATLIVCFMGLAMWQGSITVAPWTMTLVVIGAAFIIFGDAGSQSFVGKALDTKPLQGLGTISYSLYLIHWPIFVIDTLYLGRPIAGWEVVGLVLLSIGLAVLSYVCIEAPARRIKTASKRIILIIVGAWLLTLALGAGFYTGAFKMRPPAPYIASEVLADVKARHDLPKGCMMTKANPYPGIDLCRFGAASNQTDIILLGDSHADHWVAGLEQFSNRHNLNSVMYSANSTLPILDVYQFTKDAVWITGQEWQADIFHILDEASPKTIVLAARWSIYFDTEQFLRPNTARWYTSRNNINNKDLDMSRSAIEQGLHDFTISLQDKGYTVILLGQVPEYGTPQIDCVTNKMASKQSISECGPDIQALKTRLQPSIDMLDRVSQSTGAAFIDPSRYMCEASHCETILDGRYIYRDSNHLNLHGSKAVSQLIEGELLEAVQ